MKRRRKPLAVVLAVLATASMAAALPASSSADVPDDTSSSSGTIRSATALSELLASPMRVSRDRVVVSVPEGTFVAKLRDGEPTDVAAVDGTSAQFSARESFVGPKALYLTADGGVITDVLVFGNAHVQDAFGSVQWLVSRRGVQLVWMNDEGLAWRVARDDDRLASGQIGAYFAAGDPAPAQFSVSHDQVDVRDEGGEVRVVEANLLGTFTTEYDDSAVGRTIADLRR